MDERENKTIKEMNKIRRWMFEKMIIIDDLPARPMN